MYVLFKREGFTLRSCFLPSLLGRGENKVFLPPLVKIKGDRKVKNVKFKILCMNNELEEAGGRD